MITRRREIFFQLLNWNGFGEKYNTREKVKQELFYYIEMFYIPKRPHSFSNKMSPFE